MYKARMGATDGKCVRTSGTVVIGAGPAGLAVAACLAKKGIAYEVLERRDAVGSAWRSHYERLHLHTDKALSNLPFVPFARDLPTWVPRERFVEYMEAYAAAFDIEPRFGTEIVKISKAGGGFAIETTKETLHARELVMATGYNRVPSIPTFGGEATFGGPIIHSSQYKNGSAFRGKRVLVVGAGNSGAEIALDLWEHGAHPRISIRGPIHVMPRDLFGLPIQRVTVGLRFLSAEWMDRLAAPRASLSVGDSLPLWLASTGQGRGGHGQGRQTHTPHRRRDHLAHSAGVAPRVAGPSQIHEERRAERGWSHTSARRRRARDRLSERPLFVVRCVAGRPARSERTPESAWCRRGRRALLPRIFQPADGRLARDRARGAAHRRGDRQEARGMSEGSKRLAHWHPVAKTTDVRAAALIGKPVPFRLDGEDYVIFRNSGGRYGALPRACPHRRADLARARIQGERLACEYHGWEMHPDGSIRSPANPDLSQRGSCLEVAERHGALWVRKAGSSTTFPSFDFDGYRGVGVFAHRVRAPMQLVLDNFVEVEHTSFIHAFLGYPTSELANVSIDIEKTDNTVRVINVGPQRTLPLPIRAVMGISKEDLFVDDWVTYFSPVYSVYDHHWRSPAGERRANAVKTAVFFNPVDEHETELWSFSAASSPLMRLPLLRTPMRGLVRLFLELEIRLDRRLVESLHSKDTSMRGMKLGRFDKVMWETRSRVERIYDGRVTSE